jgi:hypothetical protein
VDIHKPKHVGNWRELAGEVAIIVVGVLIALGAEQLVQRLEWRHKLHASEEAMRAELRDDDGPQAVIRAAMHPCVQQSLDAIRAGAEQGAPRDAMLRMIDGYKLPFLTWDSLAYQGAMASDVSTHLPTAAMQLWTSAYAVIPALDRANEREFQHMAQLRALSRTGGALSPAERDRMIEAVETLRGDELEMFTGIQVLIPAMREAGVPAAAKPSQMAKLRERYGGCVAAPRGGKAAKASGGRRHALLSARSGPRWLQGPHP